MSSTREKLAAAVAQLQKFSDEVDARGAGLTAEDMSNLKNRMAEVSDLKGQVEAEAEAAGQLNDAKEFLRKLSGSDTKTKADSHIITASGLPMNTQGKTFGEMFIGSDAYKDFMGRYAGRDGIIPNAVKGLQSGTFMTDSKALITGLSSTSAGAFVQNDHFGEVVDLVGERELTVRDIVTRGTTVSDTIEYVRVTSRTNNAAPVAEATSSAAPTAPATVPNPLVLNAGGGYKPESDMALEVVSTTVKTIAHWIPVTKRAIADAGQVRTLIDNFLAYGLNEELEDQILNGSGSGENFQGIYGTPGVQTITPTANDIEDVLAAIKNVRVVGRRRPTAIVMHPDDWYSGGFLLAKDTTNRYIIGDPRASLDQLNQLWGLQVIVSEAATANTALVGDFRQAVLWEREGVNVMVSDQHADFFIRNLLAILAEMRAGFGVLDPQAFCTVSGI